MPRKPLFRCGGLAALAVVASVMTAAAVRGADPKGEPGKGARTFKTKVIHAPELAGMSKGVVADAFREYEADRRAGRIAKGTEERALRERLERAFRANRSAAGLQAKTTASGATGVDLEGRYQYVLISVPNADGSSTVECVSDWDNASSLLSGEKTARGAEKE